MGPDRLPTNADYGDGGQIPAEHYYAPWRTFPDACDWSWPEQRPVGEWRTKKLQLRNVGDVPFNALDIIRTPKNPSFEIKLEEGHGQILPGRSKPIQVSFHPLVEGPGGGTNAVRR